MLCLIEIQQANQAKKNKKIKNNQPELVMPAV